MWISQGTLSLTKYQFFKKPVFFLPENKSKYLICIILGLSYWKALHRNIWNVFSIGDSQKETKEREMKTEIEIIKERKKEYF